MIWQTAQLWSFSKYLMAEEIWIGLKGVPDSLKERSHKNFFKVVHLCKG